MSKTKTLVVAFSVLASLTGIGVSAGTAQAQTRSDRASIAVGEVNRALDRAEYTSFRGFGDYGFKRFDRSWRATMLRVWKLWATDADATAQARPF